MDKRKCIKLLGLVVLLLCASSARAQNDPYFQWMNAITDDTLTPRMAAHLNAAGIYGHEQEQVAAILSKFKAEEFGLEASYNNLPSTLNGQNDGTEEFYARQAALVQRTIDRLRVALSASSFQHIDDRVQHEAANIQTAKVQKHSMLRNAAFHPQMPPPMNPSYSLYSTIAAGPAIVPLTASMVTNPDNGGTSFPQWNAANLVDGNTSDVGFATDNVPGGDETGLWIDFGANPATIVGIRLYMGAAGYSGQFSVWYSDGSGYTQVASHLSPAEQGWNETAWGEFGAHRFWILNLDVAGSGTTINELQLVQSGMVLYVTSQVAGTTSCPKGCPGGAVHHGEATNSLGPTVSGPNVSPTTHINVVNSQSQWEPVPDPNPPTTVSTGGQVLCTLAGIIQHLPITYFDTQRERALTQAYISAIIDSNGMHPEAYYCSDSSAPKGIGPDWPGPDQAFPFTPSGQVVNIAFLFREYVHGTSPYGIPWLVYYPKFLPHLGIGYYVKNTMWKPDCTNWDLGFRNLPLPDPLVPQP